MMIAVMVLKSWDVIWRLDECAVTVAEGPCPLFCMSAELTAHPALADFVLSATIRLPK